LSNASFSPGTYVLLAGTKRGLFIFTSPDRENWTNQGQTLKGTRVFNAALDTRGEPRMYATDNGAFFGNFLRYSDDFGETWQEPEQGIQFPEDSGRKLENLWVIEPGRPSEPETVYAGVDPASLWVSHDRGQTWEMNQDLENHPSRDRWNPGNGGLCLHSIVLDHSNDDRMWIGISAVGCMRTDDGGKTWKHANKNTRAGFQPDIYPEFGQCIHRVVQHPTEPDVLYQQNHCGVYKTANGGDDWEDIQTNLPSEFGFPIALDRNNPETLFTIVEDGYPRQNFSPGFTVYRTKDAGGHWDDLRDGLPQGEGVALGVLRHGMCSDESDPCGVYVGTNTGQIFASTDAGDNWSMIADYLPSVFSVRVTQL